MIEKTVTGHATALMTSTIAPSQSVELQQQQHCMGFSPNVKDEPRPRLARLLQASIAQSVVSFDSPFVSTRHDGRGRWLWRLVRPVFSPLELHPALRIGTEIILSPSRLDATQ